MYTGRVHFYFTAKSIEHAGKQRAILSISACGVLTYRRICRLVAPNILTSVVFKDLMKLVSDHCNPKPSVTVQCYNYSTFVRAKNGDHGRLCAWQQLTECCDYEVSLYAMLKNRLIVGISDVPMQHRFLMKTALYFQKASTWLKPCRQLRVMCVTVSLC